MLCFHICASHSLQNTVEHVMSKTKPPQITHLLSIEALNADQINYFLDRAQTLQDDVVTKDKVLDNFTGQVVANLFFESSTRTRNSFEIAAHRFNMIVLSPNMNQAATKKGELLIDTIRNFEAMGARLLVIRHSDNNLAHFLANECQSIAIINAGDGSNEHPTQTLIDLLTIKQHFNDFSKLTIAISGDISHSRVARSLVAGLRIMGTKEIRLIAPDYFMPDPTEFPGTTCVNSFDDGVKDADIVYCLRIQKERMDPKQHPKESDYFNTFGLTQEKLALAQKGAIVMHPGPINRGIEIESSVADGSQSVILQQTRNSVAVRMAVIETLLNNR